MDWDPDNEVSDKIYRYVYRTEKVEVLEEEVGSMREGVGGFGEGVLGMVVEV